MGSTAPKLDHGDQISDSLDRLALFIRESTHSVTNSVREVQNIPKALAPLTDADCDPLLTQLQIVRKGQALLAEARREEEALLADALFWVVRGEVEGKPERGIEALRTRARAIGDMLCNTSSISDSVVTQDEPTAPAEPTEPDPPSIEGADLSPFQPPDAFDAEGQRRRLGDLLVQAGVITESELEDVLEEQIRTPHKHLGALLVDHGFASSHMIARIIASQLRLPYVDLEEEPIDPVAAHKVDASLCYTHGCVPIRLTGAELVLAMEDPLDLVAQDAIEKASGLRVIPVVCAMDDIREAQQTVFGAA